MTRCSIPGMSLPLGVLLACLLTGCQTAAPHYGMPHDATPAEIAEAKRLLGLALDDWIGRTVRVQHVSQQIRRAGRAMCGDELSAVLGASLLDLRELPSELTPLAVERYGAASGLRVLEVFPGMAAEQAGLEVGDTLLEMGGHSLRRLRDAVRAYDSNASELRVVIERRGERSTLRMPQDAGCSFYALYHQPVWDSVQAATDGRQVWVYAGMLRTLDDDDTLALVIGHEFGHAILRHVLVRRFRGPAAEIACDRLGAYLAVRAGMLGDMQGLWVALAVNVNELDEAGITHPMTHERTLAARRVEEEIRSKQDVGEELLPEDIP